MLARVGLSLALCAIAFTAPPADEAGVGDAPPAAAGVAGPAGDGLDAPPYDMAVVNDIECGNVPAWDATLFSDPEEETDLEARDVVPGSFMARAGFKHYTLVFGVPVVVSDTMGSVTLRQAARTLASLLDNDGDGKPDSQEYVDGLIKYRVIFGFFPSGAASEEFWRNADKRPSYKPFMEQYLCNMHFVEIWQADLSSVYYTSMEERAALVENGNLEGDSPNILKRCGAATTEKFDLSLWYYLFSIYYYGVVDTLEPSERDIANKALAFVAESNGFNAHYDADPEMTLADFLAWATLTHIGALECHCTQGTVQNHWRPCRASDLPDPINELLDNLPNIPTRIPNPNYPDESDSTEDALPSDSASESLSESTEHSDNHF